MGNVFAQPLIDQFDGFIKTFVSGYSTSIVTMIAPFVTTGLTLSFIIYAFLILQGAIDTPVTDFVMRSIRIAFIVSISLTGGFYQSNISEIITTAPDEMANILASGKEPAKAGNIVDASIGKAYLFASDAFNKSSIFSIEGISYALLGVFISTAAAILCAVGLAVILMSKVALAILAALGPLFIACLLFETTKRYFELWIGQVVNYSFLLILYSAVFGFLINIFGSYAGNAKFDGIKNIAFTFGGIIALSVVSIVILLQIPTIASSLSGGVALSFSHKGKQAGKGAGEIGKGAMAAARGGKAVGGGAVGAVRAITGKFLGKK